MGITGYLRPSDALDDRRDELQDLGVDPLVMDVADEVLTELDTVRVGGRARSGVAAGAVWMCVRLGVGDPTSHPSQRQVASVFGRSPQSVRDQSRWIVDELTREDVHLFGRVAELLDPVSGPDDLRVPRAAR